ncbi:hypothetical protein CPB86DRAFT_789312 [Serendipita vermifera]|nr:hypothetical protein CPB86DRAFT_789312 [Serendipita vermifera]
MYAFDFAAATDFGSPLCSTLHGHSPSTDGNVSRCNCLNGGGGGVALLDMQMWRP